MRYRKLDANGDWSFGSGPSNFFVNEPAAVAQAVRTRLLLLQGEWFLDKTYGMPWSTKVLGKGTGALYDDAVKTCILGTQGVRSIDAYASVLDRSTRKLTVSATITTIYGETTVVLPLQVP